MSFRSSERASLLAGLRSAGVVLRENVALAPMTHVRIGGPAALFVEAFTEDAVVATVRTCRELDVPLYVLGGGSNVLVADAGVTGVVMTLARLDRIVRDGTRIEAGAGVGLPSLLRASRDVGLAGLEVLGGIPAVVGGAVAMNAGTRDGQSFDRLVSVAVVGTDGEPRELAQSELRPSYRDGGLGDAVVLHATFDLYQDDPKKIFARFDAMLKRRNATQPVTEKSLGCVFKNPDGEAAGKLIEEAGCKVLRRGGVSVSTKHANYFVNDGNGTAADFLALMADVKARVRAHSGAELVPEVRLWGF